MTSRVLIADDDAVVRDIVRRYLERDGLEVRLAGDGNEALRVLSTERIDVAILDVMMPGPDGLSLCRTLRQGGDYTVPIILLTALSEEDDRIAGLEAGADDYLTKPFSPRELALRVRSVLRRAPTPASTVPPGDHDRRTERLHRGARGRRQLPTGRPDQPGVRSPAVLRDSHRYRLLPRGTAQAGMELGVRRPVHGDGPCQAVAVQTRYPPSRTDGLGTRLPVAG